MRRRKFFCPNRECRKKPKRVVRGGYFVTKWNGQRVPRYRCVRCGKSFSTHTFRKSRGQHRPDLNDSVFQLYAAGNTQRRMAHLLDTDRKTVARKFVFLGELARRERRKRLRGRRVLTRHLQLDEMETFEHTKLKPVSIAVMVCAKSGELLALGAEPMAYKGRLASLAFRKYGPRPHRAGHGIAQCLHAARLAATKNAMLTTDEHPAYPKLVREHAPGLHHHATRRVPNTLGQRRRNHNDPLFRLNVVCALLRNDLSRLSRKTWVTTKKLARLQAHLDLYLAWHNNYCLAA